MMSPALEETVVTQITDDPAVVVVGAPSALQTVVTRIVAQAGLQAHPLPDLSVSHLNRLPANLYKIIWLLQPSQPPTQEVVTVLNQLQQAKVPTTLILSSPTLVTSADPRLKAWTEQSSITEQWLRLIQNPAFTAQGMLLMDVLWEDWTHSPLRYCVVADHQLLDGAGRWRPQTEAAMAEQLSRVLFDPRTPKKLVIQGRSQPLSEALQWLAQRYEHTYSDQLKLNSVLTQPLPLSESFTAFETKNTESEIQEALHKLIPDLRRAVGNSLKNNSSSAAKSTPSSLPKPQAAVSSKPKATPPDQPAPLLTLEKPPEKKPISVPRHTPPTVVRTTTVVAQRTRLITPPPSVSSTPPTRQTGMASLLNKNAAGRTPPTPLISTPLTTAQTNLDQKVWQLFASDHQHQEKTTTNQEAKQVITLSHKLKRRKRVAWSGVAIFSVFLSFGVAIALYVGSLVVLKQALLGLAGDRSPLAQFSLKISPAVSSLFLAQVQAYSTVVDHNLLSEGFSLAEVFQQLTTISRLTASWESTQGALAQMLLGQDVTYDWKNPTPQADIQELYQQLTNVQADLVHLQTQSANESDVSVLEEYVNRLKAQRTNLASFIQIHPLLESLVGLEGKRTYAVVLQNNQELRPTGGFIQAVALITVDQGKWVDSQVFSSYQLDNKQLAVVKPPQEITDLLGENRWYLRDANWSPDFPSSAGQIAWFVENVTSKKIDGVMSLDLTTMEKMIKASGPLDLPAYNEVLTDSNLWERFEFHSELQLTDANQPPEYSSYVLTQLLAQLAKLDTAKALAVTGVINQSLQTQGVMINLTNASENQTLDSLGWTGRLLSPSCPGQFTAESCVVDTFAQVDANIGINKANYYVTRQIDHQVKLTPDQATHTRHVTWRNTAKSNAWPKGAYNAYSRFYLPESAQLVSVTINGQPLPLDQVLQKTDLGRKQIGVKTETLVGQETDLVLIYSTPLPGMAAFSYAFFDQRQPGLLDAQQTVSFELDPRLKPKVIAPSASFEKNVVQFTAPETKHTFVGVEF